MEPQLALGLLLAAILVVLAVFKLRGGGGGAGVGCSSSWALAVLPLPFSSDMGGGPPHGPLLGTEYV